MKPFFILAGSLVPVMALAQTTPAPSAPDPLPINPASPAITPITGAELPYDELMKLGEEKLVPQGASKITYEGAAILFFYRASNVAPDDGKKLEALLRKAQTEEVMKQYPSAMESYRNALALKGISAGQRARAQFGLANAEYSSLKPSNQLAARADSLRAVLEETVKSRELPAPQRIRALEVIADLHAVKGSYLLSAQTLQKLLALPELTADRKPAIFARAFGVLKKVPVGATVPALVNALYAQYLPLLNKPAEIADAKSDWAQALGAQKDYPNAIKLWEEVVAGDAFPLNTRAVSLRNINIAQRALKDYPKALAAADRQSSLPGATPHMQAWRAWDRAAVFLAQGSETKARIEWTTFVQLPNALAADKALAWDEVADSFTRSLKALPATATPADKAELEKGRRSAYENAWKTEGAPAKTRVQALLDRTQLDLDVKDHKAATAVLTEALRVTTEMKGAPAETSQIKRSIYASLATVYRADKQYTLAITALIGAQKLGDHAAGQDALALSQEAFAAKDWDATRVILLALKNVWGLPEKSYQYNIAQVEIGAQKWDDARKALAAFDAQNPTADEKKAADNLRVKIPAAG
jgi:hypothetical protein